MRVRAEGHLEVEFDDRTLVAEPGAFVLLPAGEPHALRGASQPPPRVLQISSPGGWECYLEDLFEAGLSVLTDGELDPTKINPIAARHGIHYDIPATGGAGTAHIPQEPACTPPTSS